jgi:hypothetical protein
MLVQLRPPITDTSWKPIPKILFRRLAQSRRSVRTYRTSLALWLRPGDIDGTLIKASDKKVYIAAKGISVVLTATDKLMVGSKSHTIVRFTPLNPSGTNVYFEVQARTCQKAGPMYTYTIHIKMNIGMRFGIMVHKAVLSL